MSNKGKRYNGQKRKLNLKKVFAVIIAIFVIIMVIVGINTLIKESDKQEEKVVANKYFPVYTNGKWGVINSKGDTIIEPTYDETIIIPDNTKDLFICTYDVNYTDNTFKTRVLNSKNEEILTNYETVEAIENYDENNNLWYEKDVLKVKKVGKYGLIDYKGLELLKCEYDSIEALKGTENSLITRKDGKLGLVDNVGGVIAENNYKNIKAISTKFEDGYIVQADNNKYGVVGIDKSIVLETKYDDIKQLKSGDKYVVKENGDWEIVDKEGKVYLKDKFEEVISIDGENVVIKNSDNKYGVMNLNGETKIKFDYQDIKYAFDDKYIAKKNDKYGIIDLTEKEVLEFDYNSLIYRSDAGFFEGEKDNVNTDFIDREFNVKLTGILSEINVDNGYIYVRVGNEYKYYNFRFEEKTNRDLLTGNTLFLSKKDDKYGFVNKDGIVVVDYIYDDAREQNEFGYASVKKDGLWGCINSKGELTISPAYKLENSPLIEFIGKWHRGEDLNLNYYTDM